MSSVEDTRKPFKVSQEDFDATFNRIQVALAKHENIVKSWTASSSRKQQPKTEEQLEAEDAALFRNEPPYLGVGAPIPAQFLVSDAERNNKSLRAKLLPNKGLKGSKSRDSEDKAASTKRPLEAESSDEEGGRSSLGKAKKTKTSKAESRNVEGLDNMMNEANSKIIENDEAKKLDNTGTSKVVDALFTPPTTPEKNTTTATEVKKEAKQLSSQIEASGPITNTTEVQAQEGQEKQVKPQKEVSKEMRKQFQPKRKLRKFSAKQRKRQELHMVKVDV